MGDGLGFGGALNLFVVETYVMGVEYRCYVFG